MNAHPPTIPAADVPEKFSPEAAKLTAAAAEINKEHEFAQRTADTAVQHAVRCGALLLSVKKSLPHGEFMPWIEKNCDFQQSTASRYMRAAIQISTGVEISSLRNVFGETHNHRAQGTGENEWYTPIKYVDAARAVMGGIDLDPATSAAAQKWIKAEKFFTVRDNGLNKEWHGRVWLNPPYAQPAIWDFCDKLVTELTEGRVSEAILLTHNYTDTAWFHHAESIAAALCFTRGRIAFVDQDGEPCSPTQGQAFFYYGENTQRFADEFKQFGFVR